MTAQSPSPRRASVTTLAHRTEDELREAAFRFVVGGLDSAAVVVTITTNEHRSWISAALAAASIDVRDATLHGRLLMLDAHEILCAVLRDDRPDPARFAAVVERTIARVARRRRRAPIRVLSEMVDLLEATGRTPAALALEELWVRLTQRHAFELTSLLRVADGARPTITPEASPPEPSRPASGTRPRVLPPPDMPAVLHELRGTLNAILGWATVLEDAVHDPAARTAVDAILRNVAVQTRLVDDLHAAHELDGGRLSLAVTSTDLAVVVRDAVTELEPSARIRNLSIAVRGLLAAPFVGDPARIHQALVGILGCAVRWVARGSTLGIDVTLRDTGYTIAITAGHGEPWLKTSELGVRNARAIIELHRGELRLDEGEVVIVRLPRSNLG
jgi:signal transduction histidine kinase